MNFRFLNGGMVHQRQHRRMDKNLQSSLTVIGSKGSVKNRRAVHDQVEYCHIQGYTMPSSRHESG